MSIQTISWFLHRVEFELSTNTSQIDYCIKEMRKVKTKKIGTNDKYMPIKQIARIIAISYEESPRVVSPYTQISKASLISMAMAWQTYVWHQLIPNIGDNILSLDETTLVTGIIKGDEIDILQILVREIRDLDISTNTSFSFPSFFMQIFLDEQVLMDVDHFLMIL